MNGPSKSLLALIHVKLQLRCNATLSNQVSRPTPHNRGGEHEWTVAICKSAKPEAITSNRYPSPRQRICICKGNHMDEKSAGLDGHEIVSVDGRAARPCSDASHELCVGVVYFDWVAILDRWTGGSLFMIYIESFWEGRRVHAAGR